MPFGNVAGYEGSFLASSIARSARDIRLHAADNPAAAERVRQAILEAIDLVAGRPYIGIRNARATDLRSKLVSRYPYRVHYLVRESGIIVVHIRLTARQPWTGDQ
jgi:toxin ParE1/3/4